MNKSIHRVESNTKQKKIFFVVWQIFNSVAGLLADTFQLKEDELKDAGVRLGHLGDE